MKRPKKKVLIIDDEPEILKQVKKRLEANRIDCITVEDPIDGLKKAVTIQPNLILLDLMLPKMSGLGFLRIAKSNPNIAVIPIVVLTALGDEEVAREAMDLGAAGYLTKTCTPEELLAMVGAYA